MCIFVVEFVLLSNDTYSVCVTFQSSVLTTGCIWNSWKNFKNEFFVCIFMVEFVLSSNVTHSVCLTFQSLVLTAGCIWKSWKKFKDEFFMYIFVGLIVQRHLQCLFNLSKFSSYYRVYLKCLKSNNNEFFIITKKTFLQKCLPMSVDLKGYIQQ
jgi:hypothetical protein